MPHSARHAHDVLIRARALTGFDTLVRKHAGDPEALLKSAGISPTAMTSPDSTLPLNRLAEVLEAASQKLNVPDFGLQLAEEQDISVLGTVAMIARNSADIASALNGVARYLPYHTPGASLCLRDSENPTSVLVCYDLKLAENAPRAQIMELSYAVAWNFFRLISGDTGKSWKISFQHSPAGSSAQYRRHFSGSVDFNQHLDAITLPRHLLALPINPDSAKLRAITERFISNVLRRHPIDIGSRVAALVERQLASGYCGSKFIANQLGLQVRNMQRQLSAQGLTFEDIIDSIRREQAKEFLRQPAVSLCQVAALLGYSEQASFNRACRRWFDTTPLVWRQQNGPKKAPE